MIAQSGLRSGAVARIAAANLHFNVVHPTRLDCFLQFLLNQLGPLVEQLPFPSPKIQIVTLVIAVSYFLGNVHRLRVRVA
jgi:hypothetical protein